MRGLIGTAADLGAKRVLGAYLRTPKNDVVAALYPRLGFSAVEGSFFTRQVDGGVEDLAHM
jgi:predicted enzyme involved in methoxymalonyl-ACP biosynthesis